MTPVDEPLVCVDVVDDVSGANGGGHEVATTPLVHRHRLGLMHRP